MLWIGLIIGLFLGANAGIFIAAMLFSAKTGDVAPNENTEKDQVNYQNSNHSNTNRGSYQPIYNSEQFQKACSDRKMP